MSQITPAFLLFSVALLVWSLSAGLSNYLSRGFIREHMHSAAGTAGGSSMFGGADLATLRKAVERDGTSVEALLNLAFGLTQEAFTKSDGALLMEAVKTYSQVLELEGEHPRALLGLAKLCLDAGIVDKALEFFPRYLKQVPDDLQARTDYGLTLLRGGMADDAEKELLAVLAEEADYFPARMTLAFVLREQGKLEESRNAAQLARAIVPDDETAARVDNFIRDLDNPRASADQPQINSSADTSSSESVPSDTVSVAGRVQKFFEEHSIVGPKLQGVSWPSAELVRVSVAEFPVEQMPPFAKEIFQQRVRTFLTELPSAVEVMIVDATTQEELMRISVEN